MSKVFIDRPIFAWVIAIIIMLMGIGAIVNLPVAQYPDVAPTQINIRASYPGASAETLENSVTQVLERLRASVGPRNPRLREGARSRGGACVRISDPPGKGSDRPRGGP